MLYEPARGPRATADYEVTSKRKHVDPRVRINYRTQAVRCAIVRLFRKGETRETRVKLDRVDGDARTNSPERATCLNENSTN